MVSGAAAADAVRRARALPTLGVGLHVVLADARPRLPPERIPGLVDDSGRLRCDLARLGLELACRPALRAQMRAEITAQFEAFRETGLPLDHVDVHKHFHLHPVLTWQIMAAGRRFGMRALRIPVEPHGVLRQIEKRRAGAHYGLLNPLAKLLRRQVRRAGLLAPDAVFGLAWTGAMTAPRLAALFENLPDGLVEIYTHPATSDRFAGHAEGYRYTDELAALRDSSVHDALQRSRHRLSSYSEALAGAGR